jgi:hypothetical protein
VTVVAVVLLCTFLLLLAVADLLPGAAERRTGVVGR